MRLFHSLGGFGSTTNAAPIDPAIAPAPPNTAASTAHSQVECAYPNSTSVIAIAGKQDRNQIRWDPRWSASAPASGENNAPT